MKLNKLFATVCVLFAFSAFGCDSDDDSSDNGGNNGGSDAKTFTVPEYTEGADCTMDYEIKPGAFAPFCDGNALVTCEKGKIVKNDCGSNTCIWFPTLVNVDGAKDVQDFDVAECKDRLDMEELAEETCTTTNEKKFECWEGDDDYDATVTNEICLKANNEKMYYVNFAGDTYCDGKTCSADKKSCGK